MNPYTAAMYRLRVTLPTKKIETTQLATLQDLYLFLEKYLPMRLNEEGAEVRAAVLKWVRAGNYPQALEAYNAHNEGYEISIIGPE